MNARICQWGLAFLVASVGCTADDDTLVPGSLGSDLNFAYHLEGDMAIATPRHHEIFLASGGTGPERVFLNFDGETIHRSGWSQNNSQNNTSFIPSDTSDVPAFDSSHWNGERDAQIAQVVAGVAADFADYNLEVTSTRPASGGYTMIVVGGEPSVIGVNSNALGVAPLDSTNWNPNDVGFVFSDTAGQFGYQLPYLAHTISHEIAHTLGLKHITRPTDIMQPSACHCAQSFGAGPLVSNPDLTQDGPHLLSNILPPGSNPIGEIEGIDDTGRVYGWACDPDDSSAQVNVELYVGGIAGAGSVPMIAVASDPSSDLAESACGSEAAHGFSFQVGTGSCDSLVHAYAVNADETPGSTTELENSPRTMPSCDGGAENEAREPLTCGQQNPWIEVGTNIGGTPCGKTCGGHHWSWCDYNGDGDTSDGWQFCLSSGWADCARSPQ